MANTNKVSFAVSLTPKILMDAADGVNQEMEVINENVRKSLGGSGEITSNSGDTTIVGGWANGLLFGTTTSSQVADTVKVTIHGDDTSNVTGDGVIIAEIANGEAFLLPRPASGLTWKLVTGNSSNHVGVEVLIVAT